MGREAVSLRSSLIALVLFALTARASKPAETVLNLPLPDGGHPVGTRSVVLGDAQRHRELLVTLWYPAMDVKAASAPYLDKRTAAALAEDWGLRPGFESQVHAHSRVLAPMAKDGPFPVVLLEHGTNVVPAVYTVIAEGLASNGFVVVATNHPPDSLIAIYPDGHELRFTPYWPEQADRRTQGVAIGRFAEDVLVADVRFILDQLREMNARDRFWRGHLELSKVGIVGHSMGGTTAAMATLQEARILAGVNLDGSTWPGQNADARPVDVHKPFLFLMTEEHASDSGAQGHEYAGREGDTYYVAVRGTDHMSFSDKRLIQSRFSREARPDTAFERALLRIELTRSLIEEFLGKYLKGARAPHLDVESQVERR